MAASRATTLKMSAAAVDGANPRLLIVRLPLSLCTHTHTHTRTHTHTYSAAAARSVAFGAGAVCAVRGMPCKPTVRAAIAIPSVQRHWPAAERNATGLSETERLQRAATASKQINKQTNERTKPPQRITAPMAQRSRAALRRQQSALCREMLRHAAMLATTCNTVQPHRMQSVDAPIERMMHRTWLVDEDRDESGTGSSRSLRAGGLSNGAFCMGATWIQHGCNMVVPFHVACSASNVA